jgi:hypothetical protein
MPPVPVRRARTLAQQEEDIRDDFAASVELADIELGNFDREAFAWATSDLPPARSILHMHLTGVPPNTPPLIHASVQDTGILGSMPQFIHDMRHGEYDDTPQTGNRMERLAFRTFDQLFLGRHTSTNDASALNAIINDGARTVDRLLLRAQSDPVISQHEVVNDTVPRLRQMRRRYHEMSRILTQLFQRAGAELARKFGRIGPRASDYPPP